MACLTKSQSNLLIREINILIDSLYQTNPKPEVREATLREYELRKTRNSDNLKLLTEWKRELESLQILSLTLAFEPHENTLSKLWSWASQNVSKDVILDISVNPRLIAGATVSWGGKYKDYSQKSKLARSVYADIWRTLKNT